MYGFWKGRVVYHKQTDTFGHVVVFARAYGDNTTLIAVRWYGNHITKVLPEELELY